MISGIRHSGPSWRAGSKNGAASRSAGTGTLDRLRWWLPVPHRPIASQVSSITADRAGTNANRQSGAPQASVRGRPASVTSTPTWSQVACGQPLLNGQRPDTVNPPGCAVAWPSGAHMLVETKSGCCPIISLATTGSSQAKKAVLLPITSVQPAEPSARLISSRISTVAAGSSS